MAGAISANPHGSKGAHRLTGLHKRHPNQKGGEKKHSVQLGPDGRITPLHLRLFDSKEEALEHAEEWRDFVNMAGEYAETSEEVEGPSVQLKRARLHPPQ